MDNKKLIKEYFGLLFFDIIILIIFVYASIKYYFFICLQDLRLALVQL